MNKKVILIIASIVMCLMLGACKKSEEQGTTPNSTEPQKYDNAYYDVKAGIDSVLENTFELTPEEEKEARIQKNN